MYALPLPARDDMADFAKCVGHRKTIAIRQLLAASTPQIQMAYAAYVSAAGDAAIVHPVTANNLLKRAWRGNYNLLKEAGPMSTMRGELMSPLL